MLQIQKLRSIYNICKMMPQKIIYAGLATFAVSLEMVFEKWACGKSAMEYKNLPKIQDRG